MKSWYVHYKNKYPKGQIKYSESSFDVYGADGEHYVSLQKNGADQWQDVSEEHGCRDKHDLAPIPRSACAWKLGKDGKVQRSPESESRSKAQSKFADNACGGPGKVPSVDELMKAGFKVSGDGSKEHQDCDSDQLK